MRKSALKYHAKRGQWLIVMFDELDNGAQMVLDVACEDTKENAEAWIEEWWHLNSCESANDIMSPPDFYTRKNG